LKDREAVSGPECVSRQIEIARVHGEPPHVSDPALQTIDDGLHVFRLLPVGAARQKRLPPIHPGRCAIRAPCLERLEGIAVLVLSIPCNIQSKPDHDGSC